MHIPWGGQDVSISKVSHDPSLKELHSNMAMLEWWILATVSYLSICGSRCNASTIPCGERLALALCEAAS